jgi:hypothetical protein
MLLVPFRQWVLPRLFEARHLQELDKTEEEELDALDVDGAAADDQEGDLEGQIHQFRVVHHLSRRRRGEDRTASERRATGE